MQKITTFLWFDNQAEEAIDFYTSIFKDSRVKEVRHFDDPRPGEKRKITTATFVLAGQEFMALNGGPMFKFTEAISLFVRCETQEEVDYFWEKLSAGGEESRCGWLRDKFGLSWQIVPASLDDSIGGDDPAGAHRAMQAMLKMDKLDIKVLEKAYRGEG